MKTCIVAVLVVVAAFLPQGVYHALGWKRTHVHTVQRIHQLVKIHRRRVQVRHNLRESNRCPISIPTTDHHHR